MYEYKPMSGITRIPLWLFREYRELFKAPPRLQKGSENQFARSGELRFLDSDVLNDQDCNDYLAFGQIIQLTLDAEPVDMPHGFYRISSLLSQVTLQLAIDKHQHGTWFFRPEALYIHQTVPSQE